MSGRRFLKIKGEGRRKDVNTLVSSVIISVFVALVIFVALVALAPDSTAYSVKNYGWNGMHNLSVAYSIRGVSSITEANLSPLNKSILLEIAAAVPFSSLQVQLAKNFVNGGGTLIVADNSGMSNSLLKGIGSNIFITGAVVKDPTYNWKQPQLPIALVENRGSYDFLLGVTVLALSNASSVAISSPSGVTVFAESSPQSVEENSTTGTQISSGPFPMAAVQSMGSGRLIVIGDSTFFLNSVSSEGDNQILLHRLLSNSTVYLDTSNWPINSQTTIKAYFLSAYTLLSSFPYRYLFALGLVGVSVFGFQALNGLLYLNEAPPLRSRGTEGTFNSATLDRVRKDREKYGTGTKR